MRFPLLDSLRAVGVLFVVATHVSTTSGIVAGSTLRPYFTNMTWTIAVFFLLSAFLLYRPFVRARMEGRKRPRVLAYGWGRVLRVVPAYWVALAICAFWLGRQAQVYSLEGIPAYFGFGQIYFDEHALGGLAVAWSLCVEATFYILLPIWAAIMLRVPGATREARLRTELIGVAALFSIGLGYRVLLATTDIHEHAAATLALPAFLTWFATGMGFAVWSVWLEGRERSPAAIRFIDRFPGLFWIAAALVLWFVAHHVGPIDGYPAARSAGQVEEHLLLLMIALLLFLPAAFGDPDRGFTRKLLGSAPVLYVGMISYAIYLWHIPVLEQMKDWNLGSVGVVPGFVLWFVVVSGISIAIATISWYALEKPTLSLKRLTGRKEPQPGEATAEPTAEPRVTAALSR
jgi:peptidoglycan/LPS O-acetylase OafA/YrhL